MKRARANFDAENAGAGVGAGLAAKKTRVVLPARAVHRVPADHQRRRPARPLAPVSTNVNRQPYKVSTTAFSTDFGTKSAPAVAVQQQQQPVAVPRRTSPRRASVARSTSNAHNVSSSRPEAPIDSSAAKRKRTSLIVLPNQRTSLSGESDGGSTSLQRLVPRLSTSSADSDEQLPRQPQAKKVRISSPSQQQQQRRNSAVGESPAAGAPPVRRSRIPVVVAASAKRVSRPAVVTRASLGSVKSSSSSSSPPVEATPAANSSFTFQVPSKLAVAKSRRSARAINVVEEYYDEIVTHLRSSEEKYQPNANYIIHQEEITWDSRRTLCNWLVQVHTYLRMLPETLFIAFNIVDRTLSATQIPLASYQLVGLTALLIAAKYEEVTPPSIHLIAEMAQNAFAFDEFVRAERWLLNIIKFDIGVPTPMQFIRIIVKADGYNVKVRTLAKFFVEVMVVDEAMLAVKWSKSSAAAVYLAKKMCDDSAWTHAHVACSGYDEAALIPVGQRLIRMLCTPRAFESVFEKYAGEGFLNASQFVLESLRRGGYTVEGMTST